MREFRLRWPFAALFSKSPTRMGFGHSWLGSLQAHSETLSQEVLRVQGPIHLGELSRCRLCLALVLPGERLASSHNDDKDIWRGQGVVQAVFQTVVVPI